MIHIAPMAAGHAAALEELQRLVFPTLSAGERLTAAQYRRHLAVFPEGQFVLLDNERVVGSTTTMRTDGETGLRPHNFREMSGNGWMTHHRADGEWLYGLDMGIHPDYRGRGWSRVLYRARQDLVRRLGLKGQLTVGMMNGYGRVGAEGTAPGILNQPKETPALRISGQEYYRQWTEGLREDPTLTPQQRIGFRPVALIPGYLEDPACGNFGVLMRLDADQEV